MQDEINVQVGKFLKNIKRAGQNRRAGGKFLLKNIKCAGRNRRAGGKFSGNSIIVQVEIFFSKGLLILYHNMNEIGIPKPKTSD